MYFKNNKKNSILAMPYLLWMIIFILVPLCMIVYYGLTDKSGNFTFENVLAINTPEHLKALVLAITLSIVATIICLILAYPLSLILSKNKSIGSGFIITIFILPMWMNFLLRTMAWMTLLEGNGVINTLLKFLHLPTINIINTPYAIVIGMVYNFLPFMVLPIYNAISKIDNNIFEAAYDLGANSFQTFLKITLPLSLGGIISGITMVFIPALTTFAISTLLGGSKVLLIGNVIESGFMQSYDWNLGSGLSLILMVFIILSMILTSLTDSDEEK